MTNLVTQKTTLKPRPTPYLSGRKGEGFKLGCLRDMPDFRDVSLSKLSKKTEQILMALNDATPDTSKLHMLSNEQDLPKAVDLTTLNVFTAVEDQKNLGSCTANAVIGLVEYLIKSSTGYAEDYSRIFLYKVTRKLMGDLGTGDSGAFIRDTIKAMRLFGVVPEKWWPYSVEDFDIEPDAFIYNMAQNFQSLSYLRLDEHPSTDWAKNLYNIKSAIADGFPSAFGFWVPNLSGVTKTNPILPSVNDIDYFDGGHAVLAVGYDDDKKAIKFRNSWGDDWGDQGYAWMPYEYLKYDIAFDFWTILNQEWIDTHYFG